MRYLLDTQLVLWLPIGDARISDKDPFDRLLIAQSVVEGITLLTTDATIAKYSGAIRRV